MYITVKVQLFLIYWNVNIILKENRAKCMWASIAKLEERYTEDLKVPGSIPGLDNALKKILIKSNS